MDSLPDIEQGTTWAFEIGLTEDDGVTPIDLTGASAHMQLRAFATDTNVALDLLSTDDGGITLGGTDGSITISVPAEQTSTLAAGKFVYSLLVTYPNGTVRDIVSGKLNVIQAVTR